MSAHVLLSRHAEVRCQQRHVPRLILDWLIDFGAEAYQDGVRFRFFDKAARRRLASEFGAGIVSRLSDFLDVYLIEGDGGYVVTTGHLYKRVNRR